MKEPIFKATHIVKQFGPTIALNDVDIEIYPGEIRGFIGENGSGKSTMSAIMTGIYEATSGTMEYHGKEWKPTSMINALDGGIGIIVQENGTIAEVSVAENIYLGELSKFSGVNYFEEKKVESFSSGFNKKHLEKIDKLYEKYSKEIGDLESKKAELKEKLKADSSDKPALKAQLKEVEGKIKTSFLESKRASISALQEAEKELQKENEVALAKEDENFNKEAIKLFEEFQKENQSIHEKYYGAALSGEVKALPDYLRDRRAKDELENAKKAYTAKCNKLSTSSYMRRSWIEGDMVSLKNHFDNAKRSILELTANKEIKKIRDALMTAIFGLFVNGKKLRKHAGAALAKIGANDIQPGMITAAYDMQARKLIEIAKCLNKNPEIFIVDETTTALSETGRNLLYKKMNELKADNRSVLFISHDLDELMEKCDTLTVLRDGNIVANLSKEKGEFDPDLIKKYMIGRELKGDYYRSDYDGSYDSKVVLKMVDGIQTRQLRHVNLELHKGEILGIGGLSECGMHTLGKALFGNVKLEGGFVYTGDELNKLVSSESVAMKYHIGYLSKNRDTEALALKSNIFDNIAIASINNIAKANFLVFKSDEKKLVNKQVRDLQIKCNSPEQLVSTLSGGNKQKVSLAKWIANDSEILILDCPTRGVDIGVKQFIYQLLYKMKKEGKAILMISEELPELIGMSDRILIMKDGQISKEFTRSKDLTQEQIVGYMI